MARIVDRYCGLEVPPDTLDGVLCRILNPILDAVHTSAISLYQLSQSLIVTFATNMFIVELWTIVDKKVFGQAIAMVDEMVPTVRANLCSDIIHQLRTGVVVMCWSGEVCAEDSRQLLTLFVVTLDKTPETPLPVTGLVEVAIEDGIYWFI